MLQQILSALEDTPPKERLGRRCVTWARAHGLEESLIATLDECAYSGAIRVGRLWLSLLVELDLENQLEENGPSMEHGFLVVGSGLNGDPIALELTSGKMAFLSHDLLWERDYREFGECVVRSPLGFHEFWTAAAEDGDFPVDSYEARETWREYEA